MQPRWAPIMAGRFLLLITGLITTAALPLINAPRHSWLIVAVVGAFMTAALGISFLLPWTRMPSHATLIFPILVWLALAELGVATSGAANAYSGLFVLCFAYVGVSENPGASTRVSPIAMACYIFANGGWSEAMWPRLFTSWTVWIMLGELLSGLIFRQRMLTEQLRRAAHVDALTALPNRRDLDLHMTSARPGDTMVICDLDHFKDLNDTSGHAAGDRVLADFGMLLRTCLRSDDYAARYGGEEFVLLLPETDSDEGAATVRRLSDRWAMLQPSITFSAGIATCRADRTTVATLAAADALLYEAKDAGRNRTHTEHRSYESHIPTQ